MADQSTTELQTSVTPQVAETKCQEPCSAKAMTPTSLSSETKENGSLSSSNSSSDVKTPASAPNSDTCLINNDKDISPPLNDAKSSESSVNGTTMSADCNVSDTGAKSQGKDFSPKSVENTGQATEKASSETRDVGSVNDWAKIKSIDTTGSDDLDDLLDTDIVQISLKYGSNDTPDSLNTDDPDTSYKEMSPDELFDGPASDKLGELLSHKKGLENVLAASLNSRRFSESYIEDQIHEADAAIDNILKGYKREIKRTQSYDPSFLPSTFSVKRANSPVENGVLQKRIKVEQGQHTSKLGSGDVHPPIAIIEPFDVTSHTNKTTDIIEKLESTPCSIGKNKEDSNSSSDLDKQNIRSILDEMDSKLSDITKESVGNLGGKDSFQTSDGSNWTFTTNASTPKHENKQSDTPPNVNPFNEFDSIFDAVLNPKPEVTSSVSNTIPQVSDSIYIGTSTPGSYESVSSHSVSYSSHYSTSVPSSMINTDTQLSSERPPSLGHIPNYQNPLGVSRDNMSYPQHSTVSQVGMQFSQGNTMNTVSTVSSEMLTRDQERRLAYAEQHRARVNMHYMNQAQSKTPLNDLYSMVQPDGSGADFMQSRDLMQHRRSPAYQGVPGGRSGMSPGAMMTQYPPGTRSGNISPGYAQVPSNRVSGMPPAYGSHMGNPMTSRGDVVSPGYPGNPVAAGGPLSPGYAHPPNSINSMASSQYGNVRPGMGNPGDVSMGPRMPYGQTGMQYPGNAGSYNRQMTGAAGGWPGQGMGRSMQQGMSQAEMAQRMQYQEQMGASQQQNASRYPSVGPGGHAMPSTMDRAMQIQMYQQQQQQRQAAAAQDPMMRMRQGMMDPYGRDPSMMQGPQGQAGRQMSMHPERMTGMPGGNMQGAAMMPGQQGQVNRWPAPSGNMARPSMQANMPPGMQYSARMQQSVRPSGPSIQAGMQPGMSEKMYNMQQQMGGGPPGVPGGGSYGNFPPGSQVGKSKPNMDNQNLIDILNQRQDTSDQSRAPVTGSGNVLNNSYQNVKLGNDATFGDLQRLAMDGTGNPSQNHQGF